MGLCFGAWGEASKDVHELIDVISKSRLRHQLLDSGRHDGGSVLYDNYPSKPSQSLLILYDGWGRALHSGRKRPFECHSMWQESPVWRKQTLLITF